MEAQLAAGVLPQENAHLVVLTGASGAGKTTLARSILDQNPKEYAVYFFDSIGVPSIEQMAAEYGSGEAWQRAMTLRWIERIRPLLADGKPVLLEGQMRIAFIQEALAVSGIVDARIILVDCDDATRAARLCLGRTQPELANPEMMKWARFLRQEAVASESEILDTGVAPTADCVSRVMDYLNKQS